MMNFYKYEMPILICVFITSIIFGVVLGLYNRNKMFSHEYAVSSSSGDVYYIDDYTIEDGSIIFFIDGVEYHFSDYCIRKIEK